MSPCAQSPRADVCVKYVRSPATIAASITASSSLRRSAPGRFSSPQATPTGLRLLHAAIRLLCTQKNAPCSLAKALHAIRIHCGRRRDSLIQQIIRAAPDARVVINLGRQQAGRGANSFPATKRLCRAVPRRIHRPAHRQPHPSANRVERIGLVVHDLNRSPRAHRCAAKLPRSATRRRSAQVRSRSGPASTTVPSTVRIKPSESVASSGAGAGCGSISPHHAPSSNHKTARAAMPRVALAVPRTPHNTATSASAISTRLGRSQTQFATTIPAANSHAA